MQNFTRLIALCTFAIVANMGAIHTAHASHASTEKLTNEQAELVSLLAPIALYPDELLNHVLIASTYPRQVTDANRWVRRHRNYGPNELIGYSKSKRWDPSVRALLSFPDLLSTLSRDSRWLDDLGYAYSHHEHQVFDAIQQLRYEAREYGHLTSNNLVHVTDHHSYIAIQSVNPNFICLPYYNTYAVFGHWGHRYRPYNWKRPAHFVQRGHYSFGPQVRFFALSSHARNIRWSNRYNHQQRRHSDRDNRHSNQYSNAQLRKKKKQRELEQQRKAIKIKSRLIAENKKQFEDAKKKRNKKKQKELEQKRKAAKIQSRLIAENKKQFEDAKKKRNKKKKAASNNQPARNTRRNTDELVSNRHHRN
ncbi:DUF3300 domain-containing protein [Alteromonas sp. 5E99-2]|uniref:DUF3300 domain-containing protein n=1 Tax=Alteromonas sp. 5E99-2 TaxID=2817683 RepID=UPI001A99A48E|nr:DUF3300 domain-containing protein [Alteromonas sp. 5E99-2]MBO1256268.1 DUF3300 domain-containing protein [Alteromonas sp. 5E99-2]